MRKLARWCFTHRRLVVIMWLVAVVGVTVIERSAGSGYTNSSRLEGHRER